MNATAIQTVKVYIGFADKEQGQALIDIFQLKSEAAPYGATLAQTEEEADLAVLSEYKDPPEYPHSRRYFHVILGDEMSRTLALPDHVSYGTEANMVATIGKMLDELRSE